MYPLRTAPSQPTIERLEALRNYIKNRENFWSRSELSKASATMQKMIQEPMHEQVQNVVTAIQRKARSGENIVDQLDYRREKEENSGHNLDLRTRMETRRCLITRVFNF